jgi:uncharacterized membrane protein
MATSKSSRSGKTAPARSHPTAPSTAVTRKSPAPITAPAARTRSSVSPASPAAPAVDGPPFWLQLTTFAISLLGLGVSIYETYVHFVTHAFYGCSGTGLINCEAVTTSAEAYVGPSSFHVPVAVLGVLFFVFAGVPLMSPWAWQARRREIHLARLVSVIIGICFVMWLLYAELVIIGNICLYCTSVHVITFLLFVLTVAAAAMWGLTPGRPGPGFFGLHRDAELPDSVA